MLACHEPSVKIHLMKHHSASMPTTQSILHQGKNRWHSYHVLVYISPVLT